MAILERKRLRELVPTAAVAMQSLPRLTTAPVDALVDLVLDNAEPWWRRRACARALAGRIPDARATTLVDCVKDTTVTSEVREALLIVLANPDRPHAAPLLAWLQSQDDVEQPYGLDVAVLQARASLADTTAAPLLSELAADPWTHRRIAGERALDELLAFHGQPTVLAALGADSLPALAFLSDRLEDRLLGVRLLHRAGADIKPALADASLVIAHAAHDLLVASRGDDDELRTIATSLRPGHLWALVVLHRRGHDIRPLWSAIGSPRVPLPGVPPDVRAAIVRTYAPGERRTDPRWLIEAACSDPSPAIDEQAQLRRASEALQTAGLAPRPPVSAGDHFEQGAGTYHHIDTAVGTLTISTLGPFFRTEGADTPAIPALKAAGFRHIDQALSAIVVDSLHVYYFGRRDPLSVGELLFYWQD